ncbi:MAG: DUF3592 domain-containing protein, partial [Elusimicrobiota bacterium]
IVEFKTDKGEKIRFKGGGSSDGSDYETGMKVQVVYDGDNPQDARVGDFMQFWLGPLGVTLFGLLFFLAGVFSFVGISSVDKDFGPGFHKKMNRDALMMSKEKIRISGTVKEVKPQKGDQGAEFIVIATVWMPDGVSEEAFESIPIFFDPGGGILGKRVNIYIDPSDRKRYHVDIDPVLAELTEKKY